MLTAEMGEAAAMASQLRNTPDVDLARDLDPALLTDYLDAQYLSHREAATKLCDRYERFLVATRDGIADEHICGIATDFREQVKAGIADCDVTRERIKKPVLAATRQIDGMAKRIKDSLEVLLPIIEQRIAAFLAARAKAEREAAEREAQRLAAAAQEALQAADRGGDGEVAIEALQAAQEAEARATASLPELSRVRSVHNSIAGLQDDWQYKITALSKVPLAYLQVNDAMVKAAMKSAGKNIATFKVDGIEFYNEPKLYSRKGR
jgi:predicted nucleic acid-binding protein